MKIEIMKSELKFINSLNQFPREGRLFKVFSVVNCRLPQVRDGQLYLEFLVSETDYALQNTYVLFISFCVKPEMGVS